MELIISCTEVLTLLSDEHFGNAEIKWKKEFLKSVFKNVRRICSLIPVVV